MMINRRENKTRFRDGDRRKKEKRRIGEGHVEGGRRKLEVFGDNGNKNSLKRDCNRHGRSLSHKADCPIVRFSEFELVELAERPTEGPTVFFVSCASSVQ